MSGINLENIILVIVAIILLYIAVKFIKGIIKFIILVILILTLGVSAYNILITKKSISYEINRYKIDYGYFKNITSISKESINLVNDIKEGRNVKENTDRLVEIKSEVGKLEHSSEINLINDRYLNALDTAIIVGKGYETANNVKEQTKKLDEVTKSLDLSLKDILN
ncbi:hypothetical protein [Clostridium intestinale]|uniref:Uncharacterized protein n=1 Tax=Clostridium intestinale URNW TaxID=1294142 RepID=U2NLF2_9CLOT|nr:hypothetical protein [Clostridium intestinale]ERK29686.1 hypothetical protein CINTURNW_3007 [Clostridium intestinale URNW]